MPLSWRSRWSCLLRPLYLSLSLCCLLVRSTNYKVASAFMGFEGGWVAGSTQIGRASAGRCAARSGGLLLGLAYDHPPVAVAVAVSRCCGWVRHLSYEPKPKPKPEPPPGRPVLLLNRGLDTGKTAWPTEVIVRRRLHLRLRLARISEGSSGVVSWTVCIVQDCFETCSMREGWR